MKTWIAFLVCILVAPSFAQFKIDSTRGRWNAWRPSNADMEMAYHTAWADRMRRDTLLLRLGQYLSLTDDSVSVQAWVDSVSGMGNNRQSHWTLVRITPTKIKQTTTTLAYNQPYSTTDFMPLYPKGFTRTWPVDVLAVGYQVQMSMDSAFGTLLLDTTLTKTSILLPDLPKGNTLYNLRERSVYSSGYSAWTALVGLAVNSSLLISLDSGGVRVMLMRPLKMVNDGARTQVMVEISWFTNPVFQYNQ